MPVLKVILVTLLVLTLSSGEFSCPKKSGIFLDPDQCDKYWVCAGGSASRKLCPDGLVYHPRKPDGEDPCDHVHSVPDKCKSRPKLQRAKPGESSFGYYLKVSNSCCPYWEGIWPTHLT